MQWLVSAYLVGARMWELVYAAVPVYFEVSFGFLASRLPTPLRVVTKDWKGTTHSYVC